MGSICPQRKHDICVLMTGVNNTGKTTILYQLKFTQLIKTAPTNGFNMQKINLDGRDIAIWDIGGQVAVRRFWQYHFEDKDALIYVVDASHRDNVRAVHDEFQKMMNHQLLDGLPVLVYANQFQAGEVMPLVEVIQLLGLQNSRGRRWKIQYTHGLSGEGIKQGIEWLKKVVEQHEQNMLQISKSWRRFKDILLNTRDAQRRFFHRLSRVFSSIRKGAPTEQQHLKSKISKDTSDKIHLEHYLELLKNQRSQLFEEYKREHSLMMDAPGELSKRDAEMLCEKIDNEMHDLFQEIEDVQKRIDDMGSE